MATKAMAWVLALSALATNAVGAQPPTATATGQVAVAAGGVGEAEELALLAVERQFSLKLVFSLIEGNYLADVDVGVTDVRGKTLIERRGEGPFVLARLPAGEYSVTATHAGQTISRKLKVIGGRLRTEYFRWRADPEQDLPVSRWLDKN
jgi:hypothetical protein